MKRGVNRLFRGVNRLFKSTLLTHQCEEGAAEEGKDGGQREGEDEHDGHLVQLHRVEATGVLVGCL